MDSKIILKSVEAVTKKWTKQRKQEERGRAQSRRSVLVRSYRVSIKDAAREVMESAYLKASDNGTLPTAARQIYYAARKRILELTGKTELDSQYFTQTILPEYIASHLNETADWDVVYDARGHIQEPHTKVITPLGTLDVRGYLQDIDDHSFEPLETDDFIGDISRFPTCGPRNRFSALLFIEKEGFLPLFKAVNLAERFDIAIMSTKGMPVVACRHLADEICGKYDIPLLVLHDFDKSGFSILGTLEGVNNYYNEERIRYEYKHNFEVIDLGLRLPDVLAHDLESELVIYRSNPTRNLKENGAEENEVDFLYSPHSRYGGYSGKRVELNAFTSRDFITWIESKLKLYGIGKVIPNAETLQTAYRRAIQTAVVEKQIGDIVEKASRQAEEATIPKSLIRTIQKALKKYPAKSWDKVVTDIVEDNL